METLEIIIGLIFIFLLLSLLATTVQELVASLMGLRGKTLLKAVVKLLEVDAEELGERVASSKTVEDFKKKITQSKVYQKYSGRFLWVKQLPSYLSADQVSAVISELLEAEEKEQIKTSAARGLDPGELTGQPSYSLLNNLKHSELRNNLSVVCQAGKSHPSASGARSFNLESYLEEKTSDVENKVEETVDKAKAAFKKQYDEIMHRASGWYKRSVQATLLIIGMVIAVSFDADTFKIYGNLTYNPEARQQLLSLAGNFVDDDRIAVYTAPKDSTLADTANVTRLKGLVDSLLYHEIQNIPSPLGLGWQNPLSEQLKTAEAKGQTSFKFYLFKFFGWVVTALAISLGAPFWFDMLQKVINIRNAGKKPDENPKPAN